jgi:colanic acid/amylovoran biosynthesis glycosyltransferase
LTRAVDSARRIVVFTDAFPEVSESFIGSELAALDRLGFEVRVESGRRAKRPDSAVAARTRVNYWGDDSLAQRLLALGWLAVRHPLRAASDLRARRRWRREEPLAPLREIAPAAWRLRRGEEPHVHAHFAAGAALGAMRIAYLCGLPYSVTAHAFDIYQQPRNLREKLERAAFATSGCRYNIDRLHELAPAARLHEIVMGVDPQRFARTTPYPGARGLVAVGRLVEKKGFTYLVQAVARLDRGPAAIDRLEIVGDGPLRRSLERQIRELGLERKVLLLGALEHDRVREVMERADLLVMPSVVAADGDRDSMPVVVKEALALEIPVLASDEVGLPELVGPEWGALVPPGDVAGLAEAIARLLELSPETRARMGAAGRAHVLEHCNVERETARLAALIGSQHEHPVLD